MDLITWDAIAIAVVQSSCYKGVSRADKVQRGNFVKPNKTNAYRSEKGSTVWKTLHLQGQNLALFAITLGHRTDKTGRCR